MTEALFWRTEAERHTPATPPCGWCRDPSCTGDHSADEAIVAGLDQDEEAGDVRERR